jgi:hypothetical protein
MRLLPDSKSQQRWFQELGRPARYLALPEFHRLAVDLELRAVGLERPAVALALDSSARPRLVAGSPAAAVVELRHSTR